jgi:plasmid stabilization system protein ParE
VPAIDSKRGRRAKPRGDPKPTRLLTDLFAFVDRYAVEFVELGFGDELFDSGLPNPPEKPGRLGDAEWLAAHLYVYDLDRRTPEQRVEYAERLATELEELEEELLAAAEDDRDVPDPRARCEGEGAAGDLSRVKRQHATAPARLDSG